MGVSRSPEELVAKLSKIAVGIPKDANRKAVEQGAQIVKVRVLAGVGTVLGGDNAFTGRGGKPKKVGVSYKIENQGQRAFVRGTGPMHWLERGVKPHAVVAKGVGGSRAGRSTFITTAFSSTFNASSVSFNRGRFKMLRFADGSYRPYARRAGAFKARQTWSKGVESSRRPVAQAWRTVHHANIVRGLAG